MVLKLTESRSQFFSKMLRIRMVEEAIASEYPNGEIRCPVHLSIGQEACAVGVAEGLTSKDKIVLTHRSHAGYLARGGSLNRMMMELFGKAGGCCGGRGGSMHLFDDTVGVVASVPIVGSGVPLAAGIALEAQYSNSNAVVVAFIGDAAVEEGAYYEALHFAALKNLPIFFACENNQYSVYTHLNERQNSDDLTRIPKALGLATARCDGNQVEEVYRATKPLLASIRSGNGPAFIQMDTYRFLEHCGPNNDDNLNYRNQNDLAQWLDRCPIKQYRKYLARSNDFNPNYEKELVQIFEKEIDEAFQIARAAPFPTQDDARTFIYAQ